MNTDRITRVFRQGRQAGVILDCEDCFMAFRNCGGMLVDIPVRFKNYHAAFDAIMTRVQ